MKTVKKFGVVSLTVLALLSLSACGNHSAKSSSGDSTKTEKVSKKSDKKKSDKKKTDKKKASGESTASAEKAGAPTQLAKSNITTASTGSASTRAAATRVASPVARSSSSARESDPITSVGLAKSLMEHAMASNPGTFTGYAVPGGYEVESTGDYMHDGPTFVKYNGDVVYSDGTGQSYSSLSAPDGAQQLPWDHVADNK
ncbi:hypothetical protein [Companilactobacillus mishanensis]|uniref:Lipoprotein n=1 Tax=Companilactobacillus mishanensis TaxID=2486008 RepID=A0ABW9P9J7_9LACO|nr:hypothetical protein [Companilactobacillus mishanensis]MQS45532.1 hypothetical protein [Companilactobacillus mishanensis]